MALLTLQTTDVGNLDTAAVPFFKFFVVGFETVVIGIVSELDVRLPVAVNTPTHGKRSVLPEGSHFFNITMAFLTGHLAHRDML